MELDVVKMYKLRRLPLVRSVDWQNKMKSTMQPNVQIDEKFVTVLLYNQDASKNWRIAAQVKILFEIFLR